MENSIQKLVVLVTGGSGMVGKNIQDLVTQLNSNQTSHSCSLQEAIEKLKELQDNQSLAKFLMIIVKDYEFVFLSSKECDLRSFENTEAVFEKYKPTYVINLAARVGGLYANMQDKVGFYEDNMMIALNVIKCCHKYKVKRLVNALSTCIFPDKVEYPISEGDLHKGPPHESNEGYAYAKRMIETHCRLYNSQYGTDFLCFIPTNLYGLYDNYGDRSHAIAGMIEKAYKAKNEGSEFAIWGTGKPLRQFCLASDLAQLILWHLFNDVSIGLVALVPEEEHSIKEVSETIIGLMDLKNYRFDETKSDGQYKKTMGNALFRSKLKNFKFTGLREGLQIQIDDYIQRYSQLQH